MRILILSRRSLALALLALLFAALIFGAPGVLLKAEDRAVLAKSLHGLVIVVDPGHGGRDPGAVGRDGTLEKDIVLPVALELAAFLRQAGATVIMTREDDRELTEADGAIPQGTRKRTDLQHRVDTVNEAQADLLLSVHVNAITSSRWRGAQTFFYAPANPENRRLATEIQSSLRRRLGNTHRAIEDITHQFLLKNVSAPAVTVEIGFISNPDELTLLRSPDYQRRLAWSMFAGAVRYFMHTSVPTAKP